MRTLFLLAISAAQNTPVLISYQSDATPSITRRYCGVRLGEKRSRRAGGAPNDFLIEKAFLLYYDVSGEARGQVLLAVPRVLEEKSAWAGFGALLHFVPLARASGHRGFAIHHYCWDRGPWFFPMSRWARSRGQVYIDRHFDDPELKSKQLLREWTIITACGCHDCGNAGWWATKDLLNDEKGDIKTLYSCIKGIREGYAALLTWIADWVVFSVEFVPRKYAPALDSALWILLGLDSVIVTFLVRTGLHFENGHLYCDATVAHDPDIFDEIIDCLLLVFRFQPFSSSRFNGIGEGSRVLTASLLLGLDAFIRFCLAKPRVTSRWLGRISFLTLDLRRGRVLESTTNHFFLDSR